MKLVIILCCLSVLFFERVHSNDFTDDEYAMMPIVFQYDDFDRCLDFSSTLYCSVEYKITPIHPNKPSNVWKTIEKTSRIPKYFKHDNLRYGICLPTSCPNILSTHYTLTNNITAELESCLNHKFAKIGIKGHIQKIQCNNGKNRYNMDIYDTLVACFLITLLVLVGFSTFYEMLSKYQGEDSIFYIHNTSIGRFLLCFSMVNNFRRLTKSNQDPNAKLLKSIQGIRFACMFGVILSHTVLLGIAIGVKNTKFLELATDRPINMIMTNGWLIVQIFFAISGFLLSYHFCIIFQGSKNVRFRYVVLAFLNRYIRLTPALLILVVFNGTWFVQLSTGPFWNKIVGMEYKFCRENGWINLLYLNNYFRKEKQCMEQTWFVAVDTQLFVIFLLLMTILWKFPKHASKILATVVALVLVIPIVINYMLNMEIVFNLYPEDSHNFFLDNLGFHLQHTSLHSNIGGYTFGVVGGYIFYKYKDYKLHLKKIHILLWWFIATACPLLIVFSAFFVCNNKVDPPRIVAALYSGLCRPLFALTMVVAIYGMTKKLGGGVRKFFEAHIFEYLGRLTYSVYLVHTTVLRTRHGMRRDPVYFSELTLFTDVLGDVFLSYIFGFILCMLAEMPMSALQKLFIPSMEEKRIKLQEKSIELNSVSDKITDAMISNAKNDNFV